MRLPIRSLGFLVGGLLIGTALVPAAAQQQTSGVDGQVAVRSDGAVYLISNGQRRWVATVQITDDELNAYPEGEPIYAGLGPIGQNTASAPASQGSTTRTSAVPSPVAASPSASGSSASSPSTGTTARAPGSGTTATASGAAAPTPTTASASAPTGFSAKVDIDGAAKFEAGDKMKVQIKTGKRDVSCELTVKWPDGSQSKEDSRLADGDGKCRFSLDVPSNMTVGTGTLLGSARDGGQVANDQIEFEIK
ncbi:MAG: hypothetical protein IT305_17830 [Chloroflexi bacterium]|nr:hypothetical protein [Chloroflexota bacterium]